MTIFCLKVWGDHACFTRPEMKVERVSYGVITPSAARAIFDAIFWKPPIRWQVTKIEVLKPIQFDSIRRNEVASRASISRIATAVQTGARIGLDIESDRQQRAAVVLKEVAYRLHARMEIDTAQLVPDETPGKYLAMFERRAKAGQCFNQPYLGCREFTANWAWCDPATYPFEPPESLKDKTHPLNWMLYDLDYSGREPMPLFFEAQLENGVINIPALDSKAVKR